MIRAIKTPFTHLTQHAHNSNRIVFAGSLNALFHKFPFALSLDVLNIIIMVVALRLCIENIYFLFIAYRHCASNFGQQSEGRKLAFIFVRLHLYNLSLFEEKKYFYEVKPVAALSWFGFASRFVARCDLCENQNALTDQIKAVGLFYNIYGNHFSRYIL